MQEDPLEEGMATHSSILAWRIPWTEEPGRLQSKGLPRVGHDWRLSKHALYSTENYIRYPVLNHSGKEYFNKDVYI